MEQPITLVETQTYREKSVNLGAKDKPIN